jgi:ankyrin repeat protein
MRYLFITLLLCCTFAFAPTALAQPSIFEVVARGEFKIIQEAFNSWADPNATDENDQSILMQAATMNRLDIVDVLLAVNADVNFQNSLGQTALLTALINGAELELIERLLEAGADPNQAGLAFVGGGETGDTGYSPLMEAVATRRADVVHLLIDNGADVNHQTAWGETALMVMLPVYWEFDFNSFVLLLDAGANVNHIGQLAPDLPLAQSVLAHAIAERNHPDAVAILLRRGAELYVDPDYARDYNQYEDLMRIAEQMGYLEAVSLILEQLNSSN